MEMTVSKADFDALQAKYDALEHRFEQLLTLVYGSKSELCTRVRAGKNGAF